MFTKTCDGCAQEEERVFVDSWTGLELCTGCLGAVVDKVSCAPHSAGDNLRELLEDL